MNDSVRDDLQPAGKSGADTVRRRHVIYLSGYDPRGAQGFFDLFRRTCERFQQLWPISVTLEPTKIGTDEAAHWAVELRGANWQVATQYDFLRTEDFIRSDMARPTLQQAWRALGWCFGDVFSGAQLSIFRAGWRFGMHLLCFELLAFAWAASAAFVGVAVGFAASSYLGSPSPLSALAGLAAAYLILLALRPLAERWRLIQISSCWSTLRRFGRGASSWVDRAVEAGARRLLAVARTAEADELAVVGHSSGSVIACAIVARALELDPDLGKSGPRLVLLTLGSVMPAVALHPAARNMRAIVARLATADTLAWIDCQASKDVMCFADFDPVEGIGVQVGKERHNPLRWPISFKDMFAPARYTRFRRDYFRMHYQYIMAGDQPAPYDYILLIGGPMPIPAWPLHSREFMEKLLGEASSGGERRHDTVLGAAP